MKPRILIVEDEPLMARIIGQQIKDLGYDLVATTAYAEEALTLAEKLDFNLALVDLRLAGEMDGITASIILRERFGLASILITAAPDKKQIERAIEAKPYGYLQKPFTPQELQLAVAMTQQRLQTESNLHQEQEQHKTVLSSSMDSFWVVNLHGHILDVNAAACHLTGYSRAELLKMNVVDLEFGRTSQQISESIQQVLSLGSARIERHLRCKDGGIRLIELSITHSVHQRLFCFGRDITDRRGAELRLQLLNRYHQHEG
jgi:PAS domain S-box-containing protein